MVARFTGCIALYGNLYSCIYIVLCVWNLQSFPVPYHFKFPLFLQFSCAVLFSYPYWYYHTDHWWHLPTSQFVISWNALMPSSHLRDPSLCWAHYPTLPPLLMESGIPIAQKVDALRSWDIPKSAKCAVYLLSSVQHAAYIYYLWTSYVVHSTYGEVGLNEGFAHEIALSGSSFISFQVCKFSLWNCLL